MPIAMVDAGAFERGLSGRLPVLARLARSFTAALDRLVLAFGAPHHPPPGRPYRSMFRSVRARAAELLPSGLGEGRVVNGVERNRVGAPAAEIAASGMSGPLSRLLEELARAPEPSVGAAWSEVLWRGAVVDRFELVEEIGRGGFGRVWEARDLEQGGSVAFKALTGTRHASLPRERLLREAKIAERLAHPNIVGLRESGQCEHGPFLVLELLRGDTLEARLAEGPLSVGEAVRVGVEVAKGVAHAHANGVVHRDLKPGNVFLCDDGRVKILDFGLAHAFGTPGIDGGTPDYMAPEQWRGAPEDERSDVFALGVILHRLLANELPFPRDRGEAVQGRYLPPAIEVEGAPALGALVARLLDKDPVKRPRNAGEALAELERARRELDATPGGEAPAVRVRPRPPQALPPLPWWRVWRVAVPAAVLAALIAVATPSILDRIVNPDQPPRLPSVKMLAVLPFSHGNGGSEDDAAFGAGLVETVTSTLFQRAELSSWRFVSPGEIQGKNVTSADEARRAFGATLALEGSVVRQRDRLLVVARLVDTKRLVMLISRELDVPRGEAVGLQRLLGERIAEMLQVKLAADSRKELVPGRTPASRAYELYSAGRGYLQRYDKAENLDSAIKVFDSALVADPAYALAHAGRAEAYLRKYRLTKQPQLIAEARASAQQALELDGGLAAVQLTMGLVQAAGGEYESALRRLERALEIEPRNADVLRELAKAYDDAGNQSEAAATYRRAIETGSGSWSAYSHLAYFHYKHGRLQEALALFERVAELTPDSYKAYANLGALYSLLSRPDDAMKADERSLALRPTGDAYANLGTVYYYQRRYREAAEAFQKALDLNPTQSRWWGNLGDAHRYAGRLRDVPYEYRRAIELLEREAAVNPRDAEVLGRLAMYRAALGEHEKARADLEAALKLAPHDGMLLYMAALVHEEAGRRRLALAAVTDALRAGYSRDEIDRAPPLESLRHDPRYPAPERGAAPTK